METLLTFFEQLANWQKLLWIVLVLNLTWIIEAVNPLIKFDYKKWIHARTNLFFLLVVIIINTIFGVLSVGSFNWIADHQIGLLNLINLPIWAEILLAIMILDLIAQYTVHVALHKVGVFWRLHLVHHSDTHVDSTTGTRHHPLDYVLRECFALIAIFTGGISFSYYIIYRLLTIFFTYLTHANIFVPRWLDHPISYIFVTPNMHKIHHHFERPWTDRNYGNIFSIWDRLFGTFVYDDPKKVVYGVDILMNKNDENIAYQLKVPFDKSIKTDYLFIKKWWK